MRPNAALRAVQITTGFFENILSSLLFLIKTTEFAKAVDAALMRPDAALQTIKLLLFGFGSVRAASGPHPFLENGQKFDRAEYPHPNFWKKS